MSLRLTSLCRAVLLTLFLSFPALAGASPERTDFSGVARLVERRIPFLAGKVDFRPAPAAAENSDAFTLATRRGRLTIEATSPSAAATAVNYYLNHFCGMSLSHNGDNLHDLPSLPEVAPSVTVRSPFRYRYALNYCTYNYTYSFYDWNDWERELDWMALNGVNLMLAPLGTELVWAQTLEDAGFTEEEIGDFIPGPAFTAWWLMGNLEGWGGPMSRGMMENRARMQQRILARMAELGIEPVLQGFWGMVPNKLREKYPDARIVDQGLWGRIFPRPAILLPEDPLFDRMSDRYYSVLRELYGDSVKYLGGDLFHEGGDTTGMHVTRTASMIQASMQRHFPGSKWMLQGWSGNPKKELLAGLDPALTVVIDLFGESGSTWRNTGEFYGSPWIWATVNHFGGKTDMGGQLPVILAGPHEARSESKKHLCGVGILPEGIAANPVVYDWALKTAWEPGAPDPDDYLRRYIVYRYGTWNDHVYEAWRLLLGSVYGEFAIKGEGTFESIFCARPGLDVTSVSTWGPKRFQYDPAKLVDALVLFRKAAEQYGNSPTYRYDLADLARQVLANHARDIYRRTVKAYRRGDREGFGLLSADFLALLGLQDRLTGTQPDFLLGRWLDKALHYGDNEQERRQSLKNAKTQITYWGPADPNTRVHDYANKEWSGLLADYYLPRWKAFFDYLSADMEGRKVPEPDYFGMEKAWADSGKEYPTEPRGELLTEVDSVLLAVRPPYKDRSLTPRKRAEDLLGRMTLREKIAQMRHIHFKHYDNEGEVDLEKLVSSTGGVGWGCAEAFPYSSGQYMKAMRQIQVYMRSDTRLGIPVIPVMEGLHGVVQDGSTIFPQAIAQGATFNPRLVGGMASHIADEMEAIGAKQVLAPVLDIARELRWGRVEETFGEDSHLISCMGAAYMKAMHAKGMITTPKHFVAHGTPTAGLNLASVKGGKRELMSLYVKPFRELIAATKPLSAMNCYSSYDDEAVTGSKSLMTGLLRDSLGFRGYVYSDWGSVRMLSHFHRVAAPGGAAARMAIEAGIDLEAGSEEYRHAEQMVREGFLDEKYIDRAVGNILFVKFASGLFDEEPADTLGWRRKIHAPEAVRLARQIADESAVLLENRNGVLPLSPGKLRSVAVIGPNADRVQFGDYSWSAEKDKGITPLRGIREYLAGSGVRVNHAEGCDPYSQDKSGFGEALKAARRSDVVVVFVGSQSAILARASEPATSGEGYDLTSLRLPGVQEELVEELARTGKPMIVVLVTGKPFELARIRELADAVLVQWYAGEEAGASVAGILFGKTNPSGRLPVSFPQSTGHLPCYYNHLSTDKGYYNKKGSPDSPGRDYVFSDPEPLYPFGYGLSYTRFEYSGMETVSGELSATDTLRVNVRVKNTGSRAGSEVVQLYVRDLISSVATPVRQLHAFDKVELNPGEERSVRFSIPVPQLSLYDADMRRIVEPGDFELQVGASSRDIRLRDTVTVAGCTDIPDPKATGVKAGAVREPGAEVEISGTVRNVQAAVMPDVRVYAASAPARAVVTDRHGRYTLRIRTNDRAVFELEGYERREIDVTEGGSLDIELEPAMN